MTLIETGFKGLLILEPRVFEDERGYFMETYNAKLFQDAGIDQVRMLLLQLHRLRSRML